jgi:malate:Na+ symporter
MLFVGIAAIVATSAWAGLLPKNMIGGLAVIMTLGFAFAKVGRQIPVLKDIGGPAILCLMVPSVLVYFGVFGKHTLDTVHLLMKEANLLYFVIACLVVGSILGMNRVLLIQGMMRMFVPLVAGTLMAVLSGLIVGSLFGYTPYHTFFFIIVPSLAAELARDFAAVPGLFGNTGADAGRLRCAAGTRCGRREYLRHYLCGLAGASRAKRPALSGNGMLTRSKDDASLFAGAQSAQQTDFHLMGGGLLMVCAFFIVGLFEKLVHIPGPVLMILIAVLCKYFRVIPASMEQGRTAAINSSRLRWSGR